MGKQYYCDYCNRSFKENAEARKKHLTSLMHINNRTDHYNLYRGNRIIIFLMNNKTYQTLNL